MYHQATILDGSMKQQEQKWKVFGILECKIAWKNMTMSIQHTAELSRIDPKLYPKESLQKASCMCTYRYNPFASMYYLL